MSNVEITKIIGLSKDVVLDERTQEMFRAVAGLGAAGMGAPGAFIQKADALRTDVEAKTTAAVDQVKAQAVHLIDVAEDVVEFAAPKTIRIESHWLAIKFLAVLAIATFVQKMVVSGVILLTFHKAFTSLTVLGATLCSFQVFFSLVNFYFASQFKTRQRSLQTGALLNALVAMGLSVTYLGLSLYTSGNLVASHLPLMTLPNIFCSGLAVILGYCLRAPFALLLAYDAMESLQITFITYKLVNPETVFSWDVVFLFYTIVSKVLSWLTVIFWLLLALFLVFAFLATCGKIENSTSFMMVAGASLFYLIWNSYAYEYFVNGWFYFLESRPSMVEPRFVSLNYTLYATSLATLVLAGVSAAVFWVCFKRTAELLNGFFQENSKAECLEVSKVLKSVAGSVKSFSLEAWRSKQLAKLGVRNPAQTGATKNDDENGVLKTDGAGQTPANQAIPNLCTICYDNCEDVMIDPCGHTGFCCDCVREHLRNTPGCPVCATPMRKIYIVVQDEATNEYLSKGVIIVGEGRRRSTNPRESWAA